MAAKTPELLALEQIATRLDELLTVNKKIMAALREQSDLTASPGARSRGISR
jgi:hypothetical protein